MARKVDVAKTPKDLAEIKLRKSMEKGDGTIYKTPPTVNEKNKATQWCMTQIQLVSRR